MLRESTRRLAESRVPHANVRKLHILAYVANERGKGFRCAVVSGLDLAIASKNIELESQEVIVCVTYTPATTKAVAVVWCCC